MLIEIFTSLSYFIIIYLVSVGYGLFFNKIFLRNKQIFSIGEIGIFGLFFLSFISITLHFFIAINYYVTIPICILGILYYFIFNFYNKKISTKNELIIFILIFPSIIFFEYHADYFWYHLPYINISSEFKIIFGIANINDNLGYGHIWYDLLTIFNLPIYKSYYTSLVAIVFLFYFIIILKDIYFKIQDWIIKNFALLAICFTCLIYSNSKDFGSELQGNLIYVVLCLYTLIYFNKKNNILNENLILNFVIFFSFAFFIRTNSIIFFPLIFFFIFFNFKIFMNSLLKFRLLYSFLMLFGFFYIIKNIIISGCMSYPIYFTCIDFLEWGVGYDQAKLKFYHLSAQSKGYLLWLKNENLITNIFDYFNYREQINFVSPENYLKNMNWIYYWWKYEYDIDRFFNIIYFFSIFIVLIIIFNFKKIILTDIIIKIFSSSFFIFLFSLSIFSWIYLLPQTRYGGYGIVFVFLCFLSLISVSSIKKIQLLPMYMLIIISVFYFEFQNFERINNNYNKYKNNLVENFYNYPNFNNNNLKINHQIEVPINQKIFEDENYLGKPLYCYDTKGLCGSILRTNCISKTFKYNTYIFVIPNRKQCAKLIDKYLWY